MGKKEPQKALGVKKRKRLQKHKTLLKKISERSLTAKPKRANTEILSNFDQMLQSLENNSSTAVSGSKKPKQNEEYPTRVGKNGLRQKARKRIVKADLATFSQVMSHKTYLADPQTAMKNHLWHNIERSSSD